MLKMVATYLSFQYGNSSSKKISKKNYDEFTKKKLYDTTNSTITLLSKGPLKIISKQSNKIFYETEVAMLKKLNHESIIKILDINPMKNTFYIPYFGEGDLFTYVSENEISQKEIMNIFQKLLPPIKFCHDNNIVHKDIKLENFLIYGNHSFYILIDFAMAQEEDGTKEELTTSKCKFGTAQYLSPESIHQSILDGYQRFSKATDIWSLGIILYILKYKNYPFSTNNFNLCFSKPDVIDTRIQKLLTIDWKKRPSIEELINDSY